MDEIDGDVRVAMPPPPRASVRAGSVEGGGIVLPGSGGASSGEASGTGLRMEARVCGVCREARSKYRCPRCLVAYCSVACYTRHGEACTEAFFREAVRGEMALRAAEDAEAGRAPSGVAAAGTAESRRAVEDALARDAAAAAAAARGAHGAGGAGDPDASRPGVPRSSAARDDASRRSAAHVGVGAGVGADEPAGGDGGGVLDSETLAMLQELVLSSGDGDIDEAALPPEARTAFRRAAASGKLSSMLPQWRPWWQATLDEHRLAVKPLVEEGAEAPADAAARPPCCLASGGDAPAPLDALLSRRPSPTLPCHCASILYAYAYTMRLHCGDWRADPVGAAAALATVSAVVGDPASPAGRPETVQLAMRDALERSRRPLVTTSATFSVAVLADVVQLLSSSHMVADACFDAREMLRAAASVAKAAPKARSSSSRKHLVAAERKLSFFVSWALDAAGFDDAARDAAARAVAEFLSDSSVVDTLPRGAAARPPPV
uniref:HIT-type domain-containing protein n=1 Tax=Bicosoecida sp. CB-2014 TaxID=1486930 RepID=A0A7S1GBQ7_9STRA